MRLTLRRSSVLLAMLALAVAVTAQPGVRRATNLSTLVAYPGFFHLRPITIAGTLEVRAEGLVLSEGANSVRVVAKDAGAEGLSELRGEYWDVGRLNADDPRLAAHDLRATFRFDPEGPWPRPGQVTAFIASAITPATLSAEPSIRGIVLHPAQYLDQKVTVVGQFAGRNLLGDLPDAPANSQYDFVVRSADAAIWVSNIRPRGKDFDLALDARLDTGRWLQITGLLQQGRGLQWINARDGSIAITKPPVETTAKDEPIRVTVGAPPEVLFSAPTQDEIDVAVSTSIRIQFSRDINPATLKEHVQVTYRGADTTVSESSGIALTFTSAYQAASRVLEVRLTQPLEPFRTVQVDLLEGIRGTDDQSLPPWTLRFTTGG